MLTPSITFLPAEFVCNFIRHMEFFNTGFWFSISQHATKGITVSAGPSLQSPDAKNRRLAKSDSGDKGIILRYTTPPENASYSQLQNFAEIIYADIETWVMVNSSESNLSLIGEISQDGNPWIHSNNDLQEFEKLYRLSTKVIEAYRNIDHCVEELYIGSCTLTRDISIRGHNGVVFEPFDISIDLPDDGITDSIIEAMIDLNDYVFGVERDVAV